MQSNGFGRFEQSIVVQIDEHHSSKIENTYQGASPWQCRGENTFVLSRLSARKGDDEEVVWHMSALLRPLPEYAWSIDWEKSQY